MGESDYVRWTICVSKDTDAVLRTFLARTGLNNGNLSEFVAEAVRWRLFDLNVNAARVVNADVPSKELEDSIEQALADARAERLRNPA